MGQGETEKALNKDNWMSAEDISNKIGTNVGCIRKHLNKLVIVWGTVETKTISINNNWRKVYRLK